MGLALAFYARGAPNTLTPVEEDQGQTYQAGPVTGHNGLRRKATCFDHIIERQHNG